MGSVAMVQFPLRMQLVKAARQGGPRFAMVSTLAGAVINMILDPIFIFILRWGMMGAAVATVIGQVVSAALSIGYLLHMKAAPLERSSFKLSGSLMGKFLPLGICSFRGRPV